LDHLGTIEVEVELADREVTMEVSPLQACVLYAFENNGTPFYRPPLTNVEELHVAELSQMTGSSAMSLKRALSFWVLHGVLKEIVPDTYHVLEYAEETTPKQSNLPQTWI
jgi:anaphase-promoting complex subunit 2